MRRANKRAAREFKYSVKRVFLYTYADLGLNGLPSRDHDALYYLDEEEFLMFASFSRRGKHLAPDVYTVDTSLFRCSLYQGIYIKWYDAIHAGAGSRWLRNIPGRGRRRRVPLPLPLPSETSETTSPLTLGAVAAVALQKMGQITIPPTIDDSIRRLHHGRTARHLRRHAEQLKDRLRSLSRTRARGGEASVSADDHEDPRPASTSNINSLSTSTSKHKAWRTRYADEEAAAVAQLTELGVDVDQIRSDLSDPFAASPALLDAEHFRTSSASTSSTYIHRRDLARGRERDRERRSTLPLAPPTISYGTEAVAAYGVQRLPATYAALRRVFSEIANRCGSRDGRGERGAYAPFRPRSFLDVGSGPGTALWALEDVLSRGEGEGEGEGRVEGGRRSSLETALLVEPSPGMVDLARDIARRRQGRQGQRLYREESSRTDANDDADVGSSDTAVDIRVHRRQGALESISVADFARRHDPHGNGKGIRYDGVGQGRDVDSSPATAPSSLSLSGPTADEGEASAPAGTSSVSTAIQWVPVLPKMRDRYSGVSYDRAHDVVTIAYVLTEVEDPRERRRMIREAWARTHDILVLVEPGTPVGFARVREARQLILSDENCAGGDLPPPGYVRTIPELFQQHMDVHMDVENRTGPRRIRDGEEEEVVVEVEVVKEGEKGGRGGTRGPASVRGWGTVSEKERAYLRALVDRMEEGTGPPPGESESNLEEIRGARMPDPQMEALARTWGRVLVPEPDEDVGVDVGVEDPDEDTEPEGPRCRSRPPSTRRSGSGSTNPNPNPNPHPGYRSTTGAHVVAPCSGDGACPMDGVRMWCYATQRFVRPDLTRMTKSRRTDGDPRGPRSFQDEKFSYVVLRRGPRPRAPHREVATSPMYVTTLDRDDDQPRGPQVDDVDHRTLEAREEEEEAAKEEARVGVDVIVDATWHDRVARGEVRSGQKFWRHERRVPVAEEVARAVVASGGWTRVVSTPITQGGKTRVLVCQREWPLRAITDGRGGKRRASRTPEGPLSGGRRSDANRAAEGGEVDRGPTEPLRVPGADDEEEEDDDEEEERGLVIREYMLTRTKLRQHSPLAYKMGRELFLGDLWPPQLLPGTGQLAMSSAEIAQLRRAAEITATRLGTRKRSRRERDPSSS